MIIFMYYKLHLKSILLCLVTFKVLCKEAVQLEKYFVCCSDFNCI